jgi:hypothetical protein
LSIRVRRRLKHERVDRYMTEITLDMLLELPREEVIPLIKTELWVDGATLLEDLLRTWSGSPRCSWGPPGKAHGPEMVGTPWCNRGDRTNTTQQIPFQHWVIAFTLG